MPIPMERGSEPSPAMVNPSDGPEMPSAFLAVCAVSWLAIGPAHGHHVAPAAQNTNPMLTMITNNAF